MRVIALGALCAAVLLSPGVTSAGAAVHPFGANDAAGFRNVLPPGEAGTDTLAQFTAFSGTGQRPAHFADQQPLYENCA